MRRRLTCWRRVWCMRRKHPMAPWSPIVISMKFPDKLMPDGTIKEGDELTQHAWRCERHDKEK